MWSCLKAHVILSKDSCDPSPVRRLMWSCLKAHVILSEGSCDPIWRLMWSCPKAHVILSEASCAVHVYALWWPVHISSPIITSFTDNILQIAEDKNQLSFMQTSELAEGWVRAFVQTPFGLMIELLCIPLSNGCVWNELHQEGSCLDTLFWSSGQLG